MKIINIIQGDDAWHQHRLNYFNASETPDVLNCGYCSRAALLQKKATGIIPEVSSFTQRIFDDGHRFERLARPLAVEIIGEDLYPVVGTKGKFSASFDGLTIGDNIAFEHKTLNNAIRNALTVDDLPKKYHTQMEHQLYVSDADKCLFMATRWDANDELLEEKHFWYESDPVLREDIIAAWNQFDIDLKSYQHVEVIEPPKAEPIKDLPAVIVQVSGALERCNIDEVKPLFDKFLANAITDLVTDEDFAQAEAESKIGRETAKRCIATAKSVVDQTLSISEVTRELENYAAKFNAIALQQEKAVKTQKEARKVMAKAEREQAFKAHVQSLNDEIKPITLSVTVPDWLGAMKSQRLLSSLYSKLDDALADGKIRADAAAQDIRVKLAWYTEYVTVTQFLFRDLQNIITNNGLEAFQSIVKTRIEAYAVEQELKIEAERKRIQAEEQRKAEERAAKIIKDEADRVEALRVKKQLEIESMQRQELKDRAVECVVIRKEEQEKILHDIGVKNLEESNRIARAEQQIEYVTIRFTRKQAEFLREMLYYVQDDGPSGNGWASKELESLRIIVDDEIEYVNIQNEKTK